MGTAITSALIGSVLGAVLTLVVQYIRNKQGLFTYAVRHDRLGVSADDTVFGAVRVTWNGSPVANLFSSTIELRNESLQDYQDVVVTVCANNTILLTESCQLVGTIRPLKWTPEYSQSLSVAHDSQPTEAQWTLHGRRREYQIPTMNRGQAAQLVYLNTASTDKWPSLWLEIVHKGVRLEFRPPQPQFMGVATTRAACAGVLLGIGFLAAITRFIDVLWVAAAASLAFGLIAQVPGALAIRLGRWLRSTVGG